jgi:hypothetical protein
MKTNLEGRYTSTYGFVGTNELEKQAETTFGKNWEAESDVEQIQELCDNIEKGRYHAYCIETRDDEDIIVRESDNWELSTDELKELLANRGYYTNNLWHISDVQQNYDCESEDAQELLDKVMTSEWLTEQTFVAIDEVACGMFAPKYESKTI